MLYKYETHIHTSESSKCGRMDGASFARLYKSLGYTGIIVTDHFYKGNTAVPRELPWNEWVTQFVKGYENAKTEGDRIGLDVFFAWEYSGYHGADFLIYGLDADWLYANPDQINWTTVEYMARVRESGGTVIHAHPFRRPEKYLIPEVTDGVEIINTLVTRTISVRKCMRKATASPVSPEATTTDAYRSLWEGCIFPNGSAL